MTNTKNTVSNSYLPATKSLISTLLQLNSLNEPFELPSAKRGLEEFHQIDMSIFITGLPGDSAKAWLAEH